MGAGSAAKFFARPLHPLGPVPHHERRSNPIQAHGHFFFRDHHQIKANGQLAALQAKRLAQELRFQRLRTTAPPSREETDSPIRLCGKPFSAAYTTIRPSEAERRRW